MHVPLFRGRFSFYFPPSAPHALLDNRYLPLDRYWCCRWPHVSRDRSRSACRKIRYWVKRHASVPSRHEIFVSARLLNTPATFNAYNSLVIIYSNFFFFFFTYPARVCTLVSAWFNFHFPRLPLSSIDNSMFEDEGLQKHQCSLDIFASVKECFYGRIIIINHLVKFLLLNFETISYILFILFRAHVSFFLLL